MNRRYFRYCPICGTELSWEAILAEEECYMASCPLCGFQASDSKVEDFTPDSVPGFDLDWFDKNRKD